MLLKPIIKNKFISTIIGSLLIYIGVAFILPLNNFSVYITSYIHLKQSSVTMHFGMFINLIFSFANSFSHPLGGYLENFLGFSKTILFGFSILFIGNFFFIFQQNILLCYFLAIILGIGAGIGTSAIGKNLTLYSPNKKGTISGVMGLGILIITAIFAISGEKIIAFGGYTLQSGEQFYPKEIAERTYLYFLMGEFCIPIGLILGLIFIYEYKPEMTNQENILTEEIQGATEKNNEEEKEPAIIHEEQQQEENKNKNLDKEKSKKKMLKVIKNKRYIRIALISLLINFSISFMINTGRTFGALIGINGTALQFTAIFQALAIIIIGPILGILVDKKGPLFILRIVSVSSIIPGIFLTFFMDITWIFLLSFVISVLNITGMMVSYGTFIMEVFGIQESVILGGIINGFSKVSDVITTVTAFIISLYFQGEELKIPYRIMYLISAICCGISSFLLFIETNEKFKYDNIPSQSSLTKSENELVEITHK